MFFFAAYFRIWFHALGSPRALGATPDESVSSRKSENKLEKSYTDPKTAKAESIFSSSSSIRFNFTPANLGIAVNVFVPAFGAEFEIHHARVLVASRQIFQNNN